MSVGIELRVPELGVYAFLEPLRYEVFEPFGLVMYFLDREIGDFIEECLDQSMMAKDFKRAAFPLGRHPSDVPLMLRDVSTSDVYALGLEKQDRKS
jgi:hypothetical protein